MADLLADIHDRAAGSTVPRPSSPGPGRPSGRCPRGPGTPTPGARPSTCWPGTAPAYEPTFLHRDFSHRNLLWDGPGSSGVVDWVETSTGPRWLDAAHAATNLAVAFGADRRARSSRRTPATRTSRPTGTGWSWTPSASCRRRARRRCSARPSSWSGSTTGCTRWCTAAAGPDAQPTSRTRRRNCLVRSSCGSVSTSAPPCSAMTPWSRKSTWSATSRAKRISWVTIARVQPVVARSRIDGQHLADQLGVERRGGLVEAAPPAGSGRAPGRCPTRCCCPPESWAG